MFEGLTAVVHRRTSTTDHCVVQFQFYVKGTDVYLWCRVAPGNALYHEVPVPASRGLWYAVDQEGLYHARHRGQSPPAGPGGEVVWYGVNRATPMHLFQLRIDDAQRDSGTANVIMRGTRSKWGVEA